MASKPRLEDVHMSVRKMKEIFRKYDLDGDGVISQAQLEEILQKICPGLAKKEVDQMFRKIDKNSNGTLEYEEFVNLMFLDPTAKPIGKPPPVCTVSSEAAYILFLLWEQTAGRQTRPGPVAKAKLAEAVQPYSRQLQVTKARISNLGEEHEEVRRAQDKVVHRIVSPQVLQKIESSEEDEVTQEMFVRMIWPKIRSFDLKYVLGCFRRFFAQEALSRILSSVTKAHKAGQRAEVGMSSGDLRWVFDVLDEDDDGTLSVREMVQLGALEVEDAILLTEHLDKDEEGEISLKELMSLVGGFVGDDFSDSLKGMYASSSMVPKELWQSKSMR
mmetsp:Transcript_37591/g.88396  ORF Transcript_37591/g.88396 Transcript_37591/m.88396 type:complete len:330 (+) Transcript_37591:77-1066(+)